MKRKMHRRKASSTRRPKRRTMKTQAARKAVPAGAAGVQESLLDADESRAAAVIEPDRRDDELSDEESIDREERHALY